LWVFLVNCLAVENVGAKVGHGSGGISPLRSA